MIRVLERCFPEELENGWRARLQELIPTYGSRSSTTRGSPRRCAPRPPPSFTSRTSPHDHRPSSLHRRGRHSHVVRGTVRNNHGVIGAVSIMFQESPPHSTLDWHTAPATQYVLFLSGTLEFTVHGGETFVVRPGEVLIALDTTGTGHKWRLIDDQPWRRAYVIFKDGTDLNFQPDGAA